MKTKITSERYKSLRRKTLYFTEYKNGKAIFSAELEDGTKLYKILEGDKVKELSFKYTSNTRFGEKESEGIRVKGLIKDKGKRASVIQFQ